MLPGISILVTSREQCADLHRLLPMLLEQDYPASYEVIVVDQNSTDDTRPYLEHMEGLYDNLRVMELPESTRDISPMRLALTLGFRAASYDWVLVLQANCYPATPDWLRGMGEACARRQETQMVLGYTRFVNGKGWHGLRCRFFRAWQQLLNLSWAERHGAYRCDGTNLCYRRSYFLEHKGFAFDTNLLMGATDIMVNHHSTAANTAVNLSPETVMLQDTPHYRSWWYQERLFFMETRRHFRHTCLYRLNYAWQNLLTWFPTLLAIVGIVYGLVSSFEYAIPISIVLWLIIVGLRCYLFNRRLKQIGEPSIVVAYPLLTHLIVWWDLLAWLRWLFTPKQVFRKKFI